MTCRRKHCNEPVRVRKVRLCSRHYQDYRRRKGLMHVWDAPCSDGLARPWDHQCGFASDGGSCTSHCSNTPVRCRVASKKPCRVPGCPNEVSAIQGRGLCSLHTSRLWSGLDLFAPITPGKRGRKPSVLGIPDELRSAASRSCIAYLRGEKPSPTDRKLHTEYNRLLNAKRRSLRPPVDQLAHLARLERAL